MNNIEIKVNGVKTSNETIAKAANCAVMALELLTSPESTVGHVLQHSLNSKDRTVMVLANGSSVPVRCEQHPYKVEVSASVMIKLAEAFTAGTSDTTDWDAVVRAQLADGVAPATVRVLIRSHGPIRLAERLVFQAL